MIATPEPRNRNRTRTPYRRLQPAERDRRNRRVWELFCERRPLAEIAWRVKLSERQVRRVIGEYRKKYEVVRDRDVG
jgi:DNA-binding CsgD family transcriptional regulator